MLAIGSDHAGFALKQTIMAYLVEEDIAYEDYGCYDLDPVDYPDVGHAVAAAVASGEADRGILICGTGIGIGLAANKVKGIRAANCFNEYMARMCRMHNDANILCLGSRVVGSGVAIAVLEAFLNTPFEGGRHQVRVDKIELDDTTC